MAVTVTQPSVTTSATLVAQNTSGDPGEGDYRTRRYRIKNITGTGAVSLGGTNAVTAGNGYSFAAADSPITIELEPGEALYGIVAATTQVLHVMQHGR